MYKRQDINNRFVVFDTKDLGKQLNTIGMLVVLDQIWNRITQNRKIGRRTWIYIDEIYLLFKNEYSDNYLFELWKRARKWGAIPTLSLIHIFSKSRFHIITSFIIVYTFI